MSHFRSIPKKRAVTIMAIVAMALVACQAGPFCRETDGSATTDAGFKSSEEVVGKTTTPNASATASATASTSATAAASATSPTATGTAAAGQAVRLRGALGVDHPPFAQNYGVGGNRVGMACLSGIPSGGTVTLQISGGTGAPPSILGGGGADGTVIIPFPIQQFGIMNATITGLRVNGQPMNFQADPFSYTVGGQDLICSPPR